MPGSSHILPVVGSDYQCGDIVSNLDGLSHSSQFVKVYALTFVILGTSLSFMWPFKRTAPGGSIGLFLRHSEKCLSQLSTEETDMDFRRSLLLLA